MRMVRVSAVATRSRYSVHLPHFDTGYGVVRIGFEIMLKKGKKE